MSSERAHLDASGDASVQAPGVKVTDNLGRYIEGYLKRGIQTPMAQGQSTKMKVTMSLGPDKWRASAKGREPLVDLPLS